MYDAQMTMSWDAVGKYVLQNAEVSKWIKCLSHFIANIIYQMLFDQDSLYHTIQLLFVRVAMVNLTVTEQYFKPKALLCQAIC